MTYGADLNVINLGNELDEQHYMSRLLFFLMLGVSHTSVYTCIICPFNLINLI
jgi:hypothetical protein